MNLGVLTDKIRDLLGETFAEILRTVSRYENPNTTLDSVLRHDVYRTMGIKHYNWHRLVVSRGNAEILCAYAEMLSTGRVEQAARVKRNAEYTIRVGHFVRSRSRREECCVSLHQQANVEAQIAAARHRARTLMVVRAQCENKFGALPVDVCKEIHWAVNRLSSTL